MMGLQATYIDDNRLCCSSIRQGELPLCFNFDKIDSLSKIIDYILICSFDKFTEC